jgi:hypothetical protein
MNLAKKECYDAIFRASKRGSVSMADVWLKVLKDFQRETGVNLITQESSEPRLTVIEKMGKLNTFAKICKDAITYYECQFKQTH